DELLNEKSARDLYDHCNAKAATAEFSVHNLLRKMKVEYLCTTEDPVCSLEWHKKIKQNFEIEVSAAFRPDPVLGMHDTVTFRSYVKKLEASADVDINRYDALRQALDVRHAYFHAFGTRLSDIALDWFTFGDISDEEADAIFRKAMAGKTISES